MPGWLWLLLIVAVVVAVVFFVRRSREQERATPDRSDPLRRTGGVDDDLMLLGPGGIVERGGVDHVVRGSLHFDEDGYTWHEHFLDDLQERRWLSVEDDEGLEVMLWQRLPLADVQGEAGAREVIAQGQAFRLKERGTASFRAEGTTGTAKTGTVEYVDYRAEDGPALSFERFGEAWEVGLGERIKADELTVYPPGMQA